MKTLLLLSGFTFSIFAAEATDADKLKVRAVQIASREAVIRLQQVQADPYYRQALAAQEQTSALEKAAIAELGKKLGCEIDPQTADCKAKSEAQLAK